MPWTIIAPLVTLGAGLLVWLAFSAPSLVRRLFFRRRRRTGRKPDTAPPVRRHARSPVRHAVASVHGTSPSG